jgi:hypothetical protein
MGLRQHGGGQVARITVGFALNFTPFVNSTPAASRACWIETTIASAGLCRPDSNLRIVAPLTAALEPNLVTDHPSRLRAALVCSPVIICGEPNIGHQYARTPNSNSLI